MMVNACFFAYELGLPKLLVFCFYFDYLVYFQNWSRVSYAGKVIEFLAYFVQILTVKAKYRFGMYLRFSFA